MSSVEVIHLTWNRGGFEVPDAVSYTWTVQLGFPNVFEQEQAKRLNYSTQNTILKATKTLK